MIVIRAKLIADSVHKKVTRLGFSQQCITIGPAQYRVAHRWFHLRQNCRLNQKTLQQFRLPVQHLIRQKIVHRAVTGACRQHARHHAVQHQLRR